MPARPVVSPLPYRLAGLRPWRLQLWLSALLLIGQVSATLALLPLARQLEGLLSGFALVPFWQLLLLICALMALRNGLEYGFNLQLGWVAAAWAQQQRSRAFAALLVTQASPDPDETLATLSDDLDKLQLGLLALLQRLIPSLVLLAALSVCLLLLSWQLSLLLLAASPLAAWVGRRLGQALGQQAGGQQQALGRIYHELSESLRHGRLIRLYRQQAAQQARLEQAQQSWLRARLRTLALQSAERPLLGLIQVLSIAALLGFSGWLVQQGRLSGADLLAYATALALAVDPGHWLAEAWGQIQLARVSAQRLERLQSLAPASPMAFRQSKNGQLELQHIAVLRNDRPILDDICFRLAPGEHIGLCGPSGAGKSTLLGLIAGLEPPQSGRISLPPGWQPEDILLVPQRAGFFNRSLRENLCLDRHYSDAELLQALSTVAFDERLTALPQGLDTPLGPHEGWLSGGERQRLALARALLRRPRCLLLDEASSEMDAVLEARVLANLAAALPETAWLLVSHRPEPLRAMSRVWQLEAGHLSESAHV